MSDHRDPSTSRTLHTRREFLRSTVLGAACAWTLPTFLNGTFLALDAQAEEHSATQTVTGKDATILVVLQLAGGNDGLNTVVPYADDAYRRARPGLGLRPDQVLKLDDGYVGLHPSLAPFKGLHDEGHLAIVQGVGYPNPNRSHFRSTEIWQTASDSDGFRPYGWLGSYFDHCCAGADPTTVGMAIGGEGSPQAFQAKLPAGISFANPEQFRWVDREKSRGAPSAAEFYYRRLNQPDGEEPAQSQISNFKSPVSRGPVPAFAAGGSIGAVAGGSGANGGSRGDGLSSLDFLERTALDAQLASDQVLRIARTVRPRVPYPPGRLAENLSLVGRMIAGGLPTRVYYVSQGGYDTHQGQGGTHPRLLGELGAALGAFCADLRAQGNFGRVLVMTFSEFGRRVVQNASGGTDHGAVAPMFLLGGGVRGGLHGRHPSLTELDPGGDLSWTTDFRSVYASVLEHWLRVPADQVLGRRFPTLGIVV